MRTAWTRATKILATTALVAVGALSIGCGPAPGYETQEPRVPVGYTPVEGPEPATSEELAARAQAAQQAQQAEQQGANDPQAVAAMPSQNGDVVVGADNNEYTDTDPSALTEFRPALEGHGQWVDDPTYGTVWTPSEAEVGTDFVPYQTAGHWTYSDDTNYVWVSDYSWGWAPFHYGRWAHVNRGWGWIPGRTYSGAWVTWRTGGIGYDYIGWAPAGPEWYWYNGYAAAWTFGYTPYYGYCNRGYFYDRHLGPYVVRGREYDNHTRPYVASASAGGGGGGGGGAGAGGRVAANPSVGGSGGTGRIAASPTVGPRPSEVGMKPESVVAPPRDNAGLAHARALASPSTAIAHGAAAPGGATASRRRVEPSSASAIAGNPGARAAGGMDSRAPISSRYDAVVRSPQVQGVSPTHVAPSSSSSSRSFSGNNGYSSSSSPAYHSQGNAAASPSYRSSPSFSQPSYRSAPSISSPSTRSTTTAAPAPAYHPSAPAPARPASRSAPRGHR